jgi:hypothetical protein
MNTKNSSNAVKLGACAQKHPLRCSEVNAYVMMLGLPLLQIKMLTDVFQIHPHEGGRECIHGLEWTA